MTPPKQRNSSKKQFIRIAMIMAMAFVIPIIPPPPTAGATTGDCSDVFTPLSQFVQDGVATNKSFYVRAMNETGVPWELLAAIHYRETSFSHSNPSNGQGIFQFVNGDGGPYPPGPVSDENFYTQLKYMATRIQTDYSLRNATPSAAVTPRALTANEQDINLIKNTLFSYNGRSSAYAQQASQYGYDPSTQPYEGSPYVMNRFDCPRARMGIITKDYGTIDSVDTRYGAFTIFSRLRGDSYWLSMTVPYSWLLNQGEIYYDSQRTRPANLSTLLANTVYYVDIKARNIGSATWASTGSNPVNIGTSRPNDKNSMFCDTSWASCARPTTLQETSVSPGNIGTFHFSIRTPSSLGSYKEYFNLVAEGQTWMNDIGMYLAFNVKPPTYSWAPVGNPSFINPSRTIQFTGSAINLQPGQEGYITVYAHNSGNQTWTQDTLHLGTAGPNDRHSPFVSESWASPTRIKMQQPSVLPGETATFIFTFKAPSMRGIYYERLNLVVDGLKWLDDPGLVFTINVLNQQPISNTQNTELQPGQSVTDTNILLSPDSNTVLRLDNGNVKLISNFKTVWETNTQGSVSGLHMQPDGNLVLYTNNGVPLWDSGTSGNPGAFLALQPDGNAVIYSTTGDALWATMTVSYPDNLSRVNYSMSNATLYPGQFLLTPDERYRMVLQYDGNLVIYTPSRPIWASGTSGKNSSQLIMQPDGNLVIYDQAGTAIWNSRTSGNGPSQLSMQPDGNLVIYSQSGRPTWNTATRGQ